MSTSESENPSSLVESADSALEDAPPLSTLRDTILTVGEAFYQAVLHDEFIPGLEDTDSEGEGAAQRDLRTPLAYANEASAESVSDETILWSSSVYFMTEQETLFSGEIVIPVYNYFRILVATALNMEDSTFTLTTDEQVLKLIEDTTAFLDKVVDSLNPVIESRRRIPDDFIAKGGAYDMTWNVWKIGLSSLSREWHHLNKRLENIGPPPLPGSPKLIWADKYLDLTPPFSPDEVSAET